MDRLYFPSCHKHKETITKITYIKYILHSNLNELALLVSNSDMIQPLGLTNMMGTVGYYLENIGNCRISSGLKCLNEPSVAKGSWYFKLVL